MAAPTAELNKPGTPRLSERSRNALDASVTRPAYDRSQLGIGVVHLGVGAFMRAFTAVYCDDAIASAGGDWGIAGVSLRQRSVYRQLAQQDCLYTVGVRDNDATHCRLIGAIKSIDFAPDDPSKIVQLLSMPEHRIVTITVTEKGYCLDPDSGTLDLAHEDIAHDLRHVDRPRSTIGFIVAGLRRRFAQDGSPVTIVSCDNLPSNGARLRAAVLRFAQELDPLLKTRIEQEIPFPSTMVDRIVPATTESDLSEVANVIGCRDEAFVKTEPFRQWVIEDRFAGSRPAWEAAGAAFVPDVEPFETAKLRLLNGPHSTLAYLGYLAGYEYIHEVMQQKHFLAFVRRMMIREISPVTPQPEGMSHASYIEQLLRRFANTSLQHRTWQIAMDGSQKLPQRLLNTVRQQRRAGGSVAGIGLAVAAWMRYALGRDESGRPIDVRDPMAARFAEIGADGLGNPEALATRFFRLTDIFGEDLMHDRIFVDSVTGHLRQLIDTGAAATVRRFIETGGN